MTARKHRMRNLKTRAPGKLVEADRRAKRFEMKTDCLDKGPVINSVSERASYLTGLDQILANTAELRTANKIDVMNMTSLARRLDCR